MKQFPNEERVRQTNMLTIKQTCKQQNEGRIENREKTFVIYPNNNSLIWGDDIYDKNCICIPYFVEFNSYGAELVCLEFM